jgi:hypothetical protein
LWYCIADDDKKTSIQLCKVVVGIVNKKKAIQMERRERAGGVVVDSF